MLPFQWPAPDVTPGGSPKEQVWTGLQWSPPDVTSSGCTLADLSQRQGEGGYPIDLYLFWGYSTRSFPGGGVPYHVTYSMVHLMLPPRPPWTDACENITFQQTRCIKFLWLFPIARSLTLINHVWPPSRLFNPTRKCLWKWKQSQGCQLKTRIETVVLGV